MSAAMPAAPERDGPIDPPARGEFVIGTPVAFTALGREIVGVISFYRTLPYGRFYAVKADHDGKLTTGLPARRLRLL